MLPNSYSLIPTCSSLHSITSPPLLNQLWGRFKIQLKLNKLIINTKAHFLQGSTFPWASVPGKEYLPPHPTAKHYILRLDKDTAFPGTKGFSTFEQMQGLCQNKVDVFDLINILRKKCWEALAFFNHKIMLWISKLERWHSRNGHHMRLSQDGHCGDICL